MSSAERQGELWSREARDWAELQEPLHEPLWLAMLDAGGVREGTRLCDVGCGGGGATVLASDRGAEVSGIDAAGALVEIARTRVPDGDFRIGDMQDLPFPDAGFETVISANSLQFADDRDEALREMKRICVRGGQIVIGLWGPAEKVEFRAFFAAVRQALPEPPPGKGPFELSAPGALAELAERAGLQVTSSGEADCPFVYADFQEFWRANKSAGPVQAAVGQVGAEALEREVRSALSAFERSDGTISFSNTFQYIVTAP